MLRIAIPKGSLEISTFALFENANLPIIRKGNRNYNLFINDPRIQEALMLRPQQIPKYVEEGEFDLGITGYDWIYETQAFVEEVADLRFSKQGLNKVKIVLAADNSNPVEDVKDISAKARVVTEYPRLTRRFFKQIGKGKISIRPSFGATEAQVPRLADYLVDVTETGETLRKNNKKILKVILETSTKLIANKESWADPEKRKFILEIALLLNGVINGMDKVLIKMNIPTNKATELINYIPALRPPTTSPICFGDKTKYNGEWYMVETVVEKSKLNIILPEIINIGAKDIVEINISKMLA